MSKVEAETITDRVHRIGDGIVNCYLLEDERGVTLIDAMFPRSGPCLAEGMGRLGLSASRIRAVLITHGHVDHIGVAEHLRSRQGVAVHAHPDEFDLLRGTRPTGRPWGLVRQMLPYLWRPQAWRLATHGLRHGFVRPTWIAEPVPLADGARFDVPGGPVVVATPGHTRGHVSFHLPEAGAVVSGDALTTHDVLLGGRGPRIESLSEDPRTALTSLDRLEPLDADLVLPGHGPPWHGPIADAVARARAAAGT